MELAFLKPYLPEPLNSQEVRKMIGGILEKMEKPNLGLVMKELSPLIKGKFDGKEASQMVNEALKMK
jgi:uncharacterized protein YqeY